jgi:hypothetical protein
MSGGDTPPSPAGPHEKLGAGLLAILTGRYGMSQATLERIGAFVVMWATFEHVLETAMWRVTGETPHGKVPSTDALPVSKLIARFREACLGLPGAEWHGTVTALCETAQYLAEYRNALAHGRALPASVGGGLVLNPGWNGEKRKRRSLTAHIDERLVGLMLDALHELLIGIQLIAHGDGPPNADPRVLERHQTILRARSMAGEVRYLTEAMNSEKY